MLKSDFSVIDIDDKVDLALGILSMPDDSHGSGVHAKGEWFVGTRWAGPKEVAYAPHIFARMVGPHPSPPDDMHMHAECRIYHAVDARAVRALATGRARPDALHHRQYNRQW